MPVPSDTAGSISLVERLAQHRTLGQAPRAELEWLAEHGELVKFNLGDVISRMATAMTHLYVMLSGHFAIHVDRGYGPRKVMEWSGGDVSGLLPYSRMVKPPGDAVVSEPGDVLMVNGLFFTEMIVACPWVTTKLVHVMLDRARVFNSAALQDEKMASLGRLAAGLAHELNNPASAAARSAALLERGLTSAEAAARALGAARLTGEQQATVNVLRRRCVDGERPVLSALARSDREEAIATWLEAHGSTDSADASTLADAGATIDLLDQLARAVPADALGPAIASIATECSIHALAAEVKNAATRIHQLVAAVKRFTYMDKPGLPEAVDVEQGLRDTIVMLGSKARVKSLEVTLQIAPHLPQAQGFGGQLNQVWSNLLDNAIDAAPAAGHVQVSAAHELGKVVVRIIDDGPGVPAEIRERVFDPFFTTKPVGQGTGLGLEIARRLARQNGGDIEFDSQPGRTEFRVIVPCTSAPGAA